MSLNKKIGDGILFLLNRKIMKRIISAWFFHKMENMKLPKPEKPRLFWGITAIINFSVYSRSVKGLYVSDTVMDGFAHINKKSDYDFYCSELIKDQFKNWPEFIKLNFKNYFLLYYSIKNYDIFHIACEGLFFRDTEFFKREILLLKKLGKKIIVLPYGSDAYMYSKITNVSLRQALLISYPQHARNEQFIADRFNFLVSVADCIFSGMFIDGVGRWDVLMPSVYGIDLTLWQKKQNINNSDGKNGVVKIMHSPNHRGAKGTEFIVNAVKELNKEGLNVELLLIENVTNEEVRRIMFEEADVLAEQLICIGHGLNAIEGMASGIPVISNLSDKNYTDLFRRYSFLNECPIVSSTPETIKDTLRSLVVNPELRREIGSASRAYAEKYHCPEIMTFVFSSIYDRIWYEKNIELLSLFSPLHPLSYNNKSPLIRHPLYENKISAKLAESHSAT